MKNWKQTQTFLIALFSFLVLIKLPNMFEPLGKDQGIFSYIAYQITQGKLLYIHLWDHKPPGIFYLLALLYKIFPAHILTARIFDIFFSFITSILFFNFSKYFFKKTPWQYTATLIFAFLSNAAWVSQGGNMTETYMIFFNLAAYYYITRYISEKNNLPVLYAGVLLGIAFLFKPVAAFSGLGVFIFLLTLSKVNSLRTYFYYFTGVALPQFITGIYFFFQGNFWAYINCNFLYSTKYVANKTELSSILRSIASAIFEQGISAGIFWLLALFAVYKIVSTKKNSRLLFVTTMFLADFIGLSLGFRFYGHYFLQAVPTLALLATIGLSELSLQKNILKNKYIIILAIAILGHVGIHYAISMKNIFDPALNEKTACYLKPYLQKNDVIYVSGMETPIYFLSKTSAPTKYVHDDFFWKMSKNEQKEIAQKIMQKFPKFIVLTDKNDIDNLEKFPVFMENHYTLNKQIGNYLIFRKK